MAIGAPSLRLVYLGLGWVFLALGAAGTVLPVLPTTPFLILALGAFSRSSARLERWLLAHPTFGPALALWRSHRVVPLRAKLISWTSMAVSLGFMTFGARLSWPVLLVTAAIMAIGVVYVARCPSRVEDAPDPTEDD
jgi:uncharacterized membrane protein YbaN (DUF454 family)